MSRQQATVILDAAARWKQRCLLDGGSLFTDERLWTGRNFDQLRIHFVENPDEGSEPFYEKLRRQLDRSCACRSEASLVGDDMGVLSHRERRQAQNEA